MPDDRQKEKIYGRQRLGKQKRSDIMRPTQGTAAILGRMTFYTCSFSVLRAHGTTDLCGNNPHVPTLLSAPICEYSNYLNKKSQLTFKSCTSLWLKITETES